ncbi:SLATT domain-containing protein [Bathymodiolus thermophilus thioautotrophic gill symbiont]|uniref:SMODS and SLOG-associating 2TM effector domain-containing protein n=1 Tax=Bathymodiolus thermophilus thioautotrophic gill symbiont TaxID=2360 RepID=A0A1J5UI59_9GAMM|nr:SLATT domain-containing protein [Bathymodiolus thermophilus thioautotrophic gill symbiont]OIR25597.1 hypothetical protein BGC33_07180 [Bathymodiolus thermophilus thioautotrophic gill symbiont]
MNKEDFLKHVAQVAYNVGFGAKKHFSTYDMLDKLPSVISFLSITVGIFSLVFNVLSTKIIGAILAIFGIIGLCLSVYGHNSNSYHQKGVELTKLFNNLKDIYLRAKSSDNDLSDLIDEVKDIENNFNNLSIGKQPIFSDWFAHYKFFWQHQINWIDKELNFKFFRDKIPLSFSIFVVFTIVSVIYFLLFY